MKKYAILPNDYTTLASDILAYLKSKYDINDVERFTRALHEFDPAELDSTTINSSFPGLTARAVVHATINEDALYNHCCDNPLMCIPLSDCDHTVLKTFITTNDATLQLNPIRHYLDEDCILESTLDLNQPILLRAYTPFTIESSTPGKLSHVLMMWFYEDTSSYFA